MLVGHLTGSVQALTSGLAKAFPGLAASGWLHLPGSLDHGRWHGGMFIAEVDSAAAAFEASATSPTKRNSKWSRCLTSWSRC